MSTRLDQDRGASTSIVSANQRRPVVQDPVDDGAALITWLPQSPLFAQVSIGNVNDLWGLDTAGNIYAWNNDPNWILMPPTSFTVPGGLTCVSVGIDDTIWGVNTELPQSGGNVFQWNGTGYWSGTGWTPMPGWLTQISVGSASQVWGVNTTAPATGSNVYQWNGSVWEARPGWLTSVAAASDGTVWGVNATTTDGDNVFQWNGSSWVGMGGNLKQITAGSASMVFGIKGDDEVVQWDGRKWERCAGSLLTISAAADGSLNGVDRAGIVYVAVSS